MRSTTPRRAAVVTGSTPIASTRTRARSRPSPSCSLSWTCVRSSVPTSSARRFPWRSCDDARAQVRDVLPPAREEPDPDRSRLALSGPHRVQRGRHSARRRHDAACCAGWRTARASRTCVRRDRPTASTDGSSTPSRRCAPTPRTIRRSCGGSRTRGSRSSTNSASTPSPTPPSARAGRVWRSR